jgi:uncharacterized protein
MYTDALKAEGERPKLRPFSERDHPNALVLKQAHEAFQRGDMEKLFSIFVDEMLWIVPGHNVLSGVYRGKAEVMRNFENLAKNVDAYWAYPLDYFGSDDHVVLVAEVHARRGEKTLLEKECLLFMVNSEGRFTECHHLALDHVKWDAFFS